VGDPRPCQPDADRPDGG